MLGIVSGKRAPGRATKHGPRTRKTSRNKERVGAQLLDPLSLPAYGPINNERDGTLCLLSARFSYFVIKIKKRKKSQVGFDREERTGAFNLKGDISGGRTRVDQRSMRNVPVIMHER